MKPKWIAIGCGLFALAGTIVGAGGLFLAVVVAAAVEEAESVDRRICGVWEIAVPFELGSEDATPAQQFLVAGMDSLLMPKFCFSSDGTFDAGAPATGVARGTWQPVAFTGDGMTMDLRCGGAVSRVRVRFRGWNDLVLEESDGGKLYLRRIF